MIAWVLLSVLLFGTAPATARALERHDMTTRELTVEMDGLRRIMDERDRLYTERYNVSKVAVDTALMAVKEQTSSSFASNKEAIQKADTAQHEYNIRSNEFRGQLDDQAKRLISRVEVETIIKNIDEKIDKLDRETRANREALSTTAGSGAGMDKLFGWIMSIIGALGAMGLGLYIGKKGSPVEDGSARTIGTIVNK